MASGVAAAGSTTAVAIMGRTSAASAVAIGNNSQTSAANAITIGSGHSGSGGGSLHNSTANTVLIGTNDGTTTYDSIFAAANGNVGIGTTTPGQKLSVSGTIESTSGGFKFPNDCVYWWRWSCRSFLSRTSQRYQLWRIFNLNKGHLDNRNL